MPWSMRFDYDVTIDAVHASFTDCVLSTAADVTRWEREVSLRLSTFSRRVDLIIDMSGLLVRPAVSALFGKARSRVLGTYSIHSFRYGADRATSISVLTSAAIHGVDANVCETRADAVAALLASRRDTQR